MNIESTHLVMLPEVFLVTAELVCCEVAVWNLAAYLLPGLMNSLVGPQICHRLGPNTGYISRFNTYIYMVICLFVWILVQRLKSSEVVDTNG